MDERLDVAAVAGTGKSRFYIGVFASFQHDVHRLDCRWKGL